MLDINLLRVDKGGNPDLVRESQRNRFVEHGVELVDEVIALDKAWRARQFELDKIRQELNATSKKIGKLKASKQEEEAKKLMESTDEIKKRLAAKDAEVQEAKGTLDAKLMTIGNIVHASVPISDDEVRLKLFSQFCFVTGDGEDKYLIATSEQPLCAYHLGDRIYPAELPIRYAGYSTCFRKEAGSHGRDTAGIFRVHQFEKIEQFCVTSPNGNDSWEVHEEMLKNSEDFYKEVSISVL
ncbi:hypothetical protein PR202_gb18908 [Eleusine coracana subsp. coracana]|uniref:serine--tRNA ligase n=1 Tax=Eleusine coracana subsp. coracana TaxID=191504 RepID=A0AAV5F7F0_ELECO|nr:hypothetical protein PR202_gb18908 [Eleusine coracana subsp. coracana]